MGILYDGHYRTRFGNGSTVLMCIPDLYLIINEIIDFMKDQTIHKNPLGFY
jgi:hypothetical protein